MSSTTHFPDTEGFQQQSDNFMSWLQASSGVQINPKLRLADLRESGAGRGVGKWLKYLPKYKISPTEYPKNECHKSVHRSLTYPPDYSGTG
jgi:hypothetical protein